MATRKARSQIVSFLLSYTSMNVNDINNQLETALDLADKLPYGDSSLEIKEALSECGAKNARHIGKVNEAIELKRVVSDIKHEVQSQLIQNEKTRKRVSTIAKELRKIHREAIQKLTKESDIYSFGVVLLEIVTGRKAIEREEKEGQISVVYYQVFLYYIFQITVFMEMVWHSSLQVQIFQKQIT